MFHLTLSIYIYITYVCIFNCIYVYSHVRIYAHIRLSFSLTSIRVTPPRNPVSRSIKCQNSSGHLRPPPPAADAWLQLGVWVFGFRPGVSCPEPLETLKPKEPGRGSSDKNS